MPSLREVLANHGPTLLLDAAGSKVHAGWLTVEAAPRWASAEEEAGAAVFRLIERLQIDINAAASFVFCEGPGSVLGIRTSAVALRTWQVLQDRPAFAYRSLELLAAVRGRPGLTVIADARKQSWFAITLDEAGNLGPLTRCVPEVLRPPLATPAGFRQWSPLPPIAVDPIAYDLPALWHDAAGVELLRAAPAPDALQFEEPRYATWTPAIHRRPAAADESARTSRAP